MVLTPGQWPAALVCPRWLAQGAVRRAGRGRPTRRPRRVVGDTGYRSQRMRPDARQPGMRITLARQRHEGRKGPLDRAIDRTRERVERMSNRVKPHRRLATRYETCAINDHALWLIAATLRW